MAAVGVQQPPKPQLLQVPKRPAMLRRKTREAFQAQTSIHRMKKNKEEGAIIGINVRDTTCATSIARADPLNRVSSLA
jgi:hypothetical protein